MYYQNVTRVDNFLTVFRGLSPSEIFWQSWPLHHCQLGTLFSSWILKRLSHETETGWKFYSWIEYTHRYKKILWRFLHYQSLLEPSVKTKILQRRCKIAKWSPIGMIMGEPSYNVSREYLISSDESASQYFIHDGQLQECISYPLVKRLINQFFCRVAILRVLPRAFLLILWGT